MIYWVQRILRSSAVVAQVAVNHLVGGSNPSSGANFERRLKLEL